jgi:predicted RNase H-like HicB family nuclease
LGPRFGANGPNRGILTMKVVASPAMHTKTYSVSCQWDSEASVWYVAESDVPGLVTEASTLEELEAKLMRMIPELLELNEGLERPVTVPFELVARKRELAQLT